MFVSFSFMDMLRKNERQQSDYKMLSFSYLLYLLIDLQLLPRKMLGNFHLKPLPQQISGTQVKRKRQTLLFVFGFVGKGDLDNLQREQMCFIFNVNITLLNIRFLPDFVSVFSFLSCLCFSPQGHTPPFCP